VVGVDDATLIGLPKGLVDCKAEDLRRADGAFVDVIASKTTLAMPTGIEPWAHGRVKVQYEGPTRALRKGDELMVNDHRLLVTGRVDLGPRFLAKPVLYTTYSRAVFMSPRQRSLLSFVLVSPEAGLNATVLARRIEDQTGLRARTSAEFSDDTFWYYMLKTGVVSRIVFMISTAVVVGLSVSSLLFYLFTTENAPYYALLKAMGTTDAMLTRMIVLQALVGTMCGLGLGLGASCLLGHSLSGNSMPYAMVWQVILASSGAIVVVTIVASIISVRRIVRLEPAMVFK
jgi:putative ABC transport system permease protein